MKRRKWEIFRRPELVFSPFFLSFLFSGTPGLFSAPPIKKTPPVSLFWGGGGRKGGKFDSFFSFLRMGVVWNSAHCASPPPYSPFCQIKFNDYPQPPFPFFRFLFPSQNSQYPRFPKKIETAHHFFAKKKKQYLCCSKSCEKYEIRTHLDFADPQLKVKKIILFFFWWWWWPTNLNCLRHTKNEMEN